MEDRSCLRAQHPELVRWSMSCSFRSSLSLNRPHAWCFAPNLTFCTLFADTKQEQRTQRTRNRGINWTLPRPQRCVHGRLHWPTRPRRIQRYVDHSTFRALFLPYCRVPNAAQRPDVEKSALRRKPLRWPLLFAPLAHCRVDLAHSLLKVTSRHSYSWQILTRRSTRRDVSRRALPLAIVAWH